MKTTQMKRNEQLKMFGYGSINILLPIDLKHKIEGEARGKGLNTSEFLRSKLFGKKYTKITPVIK